MYCKDKKDCPESDNKTGRIRKLVAPNSRAFFLLYPASLTHRRAACACAFCCGRWGTLLPFCRSPREAHQMHIDLR